MIQLTTRGYSICNVSKDFFVMLFAVRRGKSKKDGPGQDTYIVCIYQGKIPG